MKITRVIKDFTIGLLMGAANIVPGVSGGTVALIMGIYDKLILAINEIPKDIPIAFIKLDFKGVKERFEKVEYWFLGALFFGSLFAVISIARGLSHLIETFPAPTYALFFGLISGSVVIIYKYIDKVDIWAVLSAFIGFLTISLILSLREISNIHHPVMIFLGGMFSIVSMILPGISGSYILIILGQYEYMLEALYSFDIFIVVIFLTGGFVGLFGLAKILGFLLEWSRSVTIAFLFGLMLGGLREPLSEAVGEAVSPWEIILPALIGAVVVIVLEYWYLLKKKSE